MDQAQKMTKEEFIEKVSKRNISEDDALNKLAEELYHYEKKYKMRSEVFFKIIVGTPAEDTPDFLTWASCYRSYFRLFQSKFSIKSVAYAF
ncbi:MAG: hypothetical protein JW866_11070 [Ignavibacteriales bacterium]|nr:hypothetical protein [Ignavibacteriales bacterium]